MGEGRDVNDISCLPDCIHTNCEPFQSLYELRFRQLFQTDSGVVHWHAPNFKKLSVHQSNKLNSDVK